MHIFEFEIQSDKYAVPCKLYEPEITPQLVVIGVHGFAGDKESSVLSALAQSLCDRNSALVCFDFPAHGKSGAEDSALSVSNCKNDLEKVIGYVKNRYPHSRYGIFATSYGGYITLLSMPRLSDFSIVLRAPAVYMDKVFTQKLIPVSEAEFISNGGAQLGFERQMFVSSSFLDELKNNPVGDIKSPLVIIHGTKDDIVSYQDIEDFCKKNENIKLIPIKNADHRFKKTGEIDLIIKNAMEWYFS